MSPLKIFKGEKLLAEIVGSGGSCTVEKDISVFYMGDQTRQYTVGEGNQVVDSNIISTDLPVVLAIHSRLVKHPDFGRPADVISEYLKLVYSA